MTTTIEVESSLLGTIILDRDGLREAVADLKQRLEQAELINELMYLAEPLLDAERRELDELRAFKLRISAALELPPPSPVPRAQFVLRPQPASLPAP